jgi:drug/metabolite transporter (DMT)-like permease
MLFGLTPLATSLMAAAWLEESALTPAKLAGMALGIAGLTLIFWANLGSPGAAGAAAGRAAMGVGALVAAVSIYSATLVWIKRIGDDSPPLAITAGTLAVSLPLFALVWALAEGRVPEHLPGRSWAAIVYLGVFGSVVGFALYYYVVKHLEAGRVALITLITPLMALLLGALLNGETPQPQVWVGTACIVLGLSLHQWETLARVALHPRA